MLRGGRWRAGLAVAVYTLLVVSLFTPLYDPLKSGREDWWAVAVLVVSAHLAVGFAVARWWVVVLPVTLAVVATLVESTEGRGTEVLIFALPLVALTMAGWGLGRALKRQRGSIALGLFAVATLPAVWAAVETARRGPHVPPSVQARLPIELSLGNLCPEAQTPADVERDIRRRTDALIRELRRRPNHLVTFTYSYSDTPDERRDITLRELAEEGLADLESGGPNCDPELERRIRAAL
jgi:hypothetical protein